MAIRYNEAEERNNGLDLGRACPINPKVVSSELLPIAATQWIKIQQNSMGWLGSVPKVHNRGALYGATPVYSAR
jgi:hypothetical protein